jgi:mannitol-specific phosphotransferase system IIBC component
MINMANPETKGVFKSFFEWYHRNDTVQALGNAFSMAEDAMNNMWESGKIGKSNALALQSMIGLGDITGATASSTVGAFMSTVRNAMEKKKQDEFEAAKKRVEDAEKEEARAQEVKNLKSLINKMEIAHAKKLLALADKLKKEARKTDDEKGERMAPISQTQQNDAYVNEDKKMTKKYSSYSQQQTITENFRRFINEAGYYGLGAEPFGAEKYRKKIEGLEKNLEDMPYSDPRMPKLEAATKLAVSEILSNIEDEDTRMGVEEIVADLLGTKYIP